VIQGQLLQVKLQQIMFSWLLFNLLHSGQAIFSLTFIKLCY